MAEDADPFYCFCCYKVRKDEQVAALMDLVNSLKEDIVALKTAVAARPPLPCTPALPTDQVSKDTVTEKPSAMNGEPNSHTPPNVSRGSYTDKKFNVILYGINECQPGMSKLSRLQSDLASVVSVLSTIDSSIHIQSIKDCFRLGKFSPGKPRPRPILVRFIRIAEVTSILSRKGKLSRPYSIKPDMSYEQRLRESVIMKERWSLIQSGIDRKDIKIKDDRLFVHNKLHGQVKNKKFHPDCATSVLSSPDTLDTPRNSVDGTSIVEGNLQSCCHVHNLVQSITPSVNTMIPVSSSQSISVDDNLPPPSLNSSPTNVPPPVAQSNSGQPQS